MTESVCPSTSQALAVSPTRTPNGFARKVFAEVVDESHRLIPWELPICPRPRECRRGEHACAGAALAAAEGLNVELPVEARKMAASHSVRRKLDGAGLRTRRQPAPATPRRCSHWPLSLEVQELLTQ
jgi:hypothetical protein